MPKMCLDFVIYKKQAAMWFPVQGRSQEFVHGGADSKVEIDDDEYHHCMNSLYF